MAHDGWKSRKLWVGIGCLAVPFAAATAMTWAGIMDAQQWVSFCQLHIPATFGLLVGANVAEKIGTSHRP